MNSSQLLYKISDLKYNIRMKEFEYTAALNANDTLKTDLYKAALIVLKEDLDKTVKEYDAMQADNANNKTVETKKPRKWPVFFSFRTATNKK